jgi:hypothetical protein
MKVVGGGLLDWKWDGMSGMDIFLMVNFVGNRVGEVIV